MTATSAQVRFSEDEPSQKVSDGKQLVDYLQSLVAKCRPERPIVVGVHVHGYEVTVGLGLPESFVHIEAESGEPPYFITVGDTTAGGVVVFYFHGEHHTEILRRHVISAPEALRIVREFFETGARSSSVEWEQI